MLSVKRPGCEGSNVIESQQVLECMRSGEAQGEARGQIKGRIELLLNVLALRFPSGASRDLEAAIRAATNCEQLHGRLGIAVKVDSLDDFQQEAGL
jgi:hypothetical protein